MRRLLILFAVAATALLVWLVLRGRGSAAERAEPSRGAPAAEASPTGSDGAPARRGGTEDAPGSATAAAKAEGVRVHVVAEGRPLEDAFVYVSSVGEQHDLAKEEPGTWFAAVTGDLMVGAAHERHGPARREVRAEAGEVTEVTLDLPAGETLDLLVVTDPGDAPVAGASVYVLRAGEKQLDGGNTGLGDMIGGDENFDISIFGTLDVADFMTVGGLPSVQIPKLLTDADGRVRITSLPKGTVDLIVSHPDHVPTRLRSKPVGKEAVARLSSGGSLTVLAPLVDGRAAEGYLCGAIRPGLMLSMPVGSATVDAEGRAEFAHLPPGPLKILIVKAHHPLALMGLAMGGMVVETESGNVEEKGHGEEEPPESIEPIASGAVTISRGEHKTLDLREAIGARIEGVLVAGEEAKEGAMVVLQSGDQQVGMKMTDEEGRFAFERVATGSYRVSAAGGAGGVARAECEVKEGDKVVTVRLEYPVGAIVGRILGADGKPAKGRVLVAPREGIAGQASNLGELIEQLAGFADSDEEGAFRVAGMPPGAYRVLGAVGKRLDFTDVTLRENEEVKVELRVDDGRVRRLTVQLEDADRNPVEGTLVVLGPKGGAAEMLALMDGEEMTGGQAKATHDLFLAPGRYRLVAHAPGLAPVLGEAVDIAGDRDVTLTLGRGVSVEILLEGPDGPLANRDVDVRNEHGIRLSGHTPLEMLLASGMMRTDGAGLLALDAVPPGSYSVFLESKERGRVEVRKMPVTKRIRVD